MLEALRFGVMAPPIHLQSRAFSDGAVSGRVICTGHIANWGYGTGLGRSGTMNAIAYDDSNIDMCAAIYNQRLDKKLFHSTSIEMGAWQNDIRPSHP